MNWFHKLQLRFFALFKKDALDAQMDDEMRSHIEMQTQENIQAGMPPEEAHLAALREFGWVESIQDMCRDQRGVNWLEHLGQDFRYGARMLRKNPGFAAMAALTLAFGIGACTAIFSLIDAMLIRALSFPDANRVAVLWADNHSRSSGLPSFPPANADVAEWRRHTESFERIAAFSPRTANIVDGGDPERVGAAGVTAGFFETLGVSPFLGRPLSLEEEMPGGPPVALIGYGLWQRRFGADPALVGKGISINGSTHTVIGILPPDFDFPRGAEWPAFYPFSGRTEIWLPLGFRAQDDGTGWSNWASRDERGLIAIGRLKRGSGLRQAQAEMAVYSAREAKDHSETHKGWSIQLVSLRDQVTGKFQKALAILFAAAGLLLLIACANVANLILARSVARQREMAVRAALGAGRGRLVRQILAECFLLAGIGCGLGLAIAEGCLRIFLVLNPIAHSRLDNASLDLTVLGFATVMALITGALFGLAPALQASRFNLRKALDDGGRGTGGSIRDRVRGWLVAAEVALALVLLTTAGLMVRSFFRLQAVQPGFRSDGVLVFEVQLSSRYAGDDSQIRFFQQLTDRLQGLPGVRAAGAISYLPLGGGENMGRFTIEGESPIQPGAEPSTERRWITPGYFAAMGIQVRRGRGFTSSDAADQPRVAVINETMAKRYFGAGDPLGRRVNVGGALRAIVGIVSDVKSASLENEVRPQLYIPNAQWAWGGMTVVLHCDGDPLAMASAARRELKALDPLLPAANMRTMKQVASNAGSVRRYNMALLAFFAFAALLLTMMGIYGVVAFLVGRQTREIGVRMALGAQRRDVIRLILRQGLRPVLFGSIAGLMGSLLAARLVASQLYGVSAADPLTLVLIVGLLFASALIACWLPARRATKVDPMVALRCE